MCIRDSNTTNTTNTTTATKHHHHHHHHLTPMRLIVEKERPSIEELCASRQGWARPGLMRKTPPSESPHRKSAGPTEAVRVTWIGKE